MVCTISYFVLLNMFLNLNTLNLFVFVFSVGIRSHCVKTTTWHGKIMYNYLVILSNNNVKLVLPQQVYQAKTMPFCSLTVQSRNKPIKHCINFNIWPTWLLNYMKVRKKYRIFFLGNLIRVNLLQAKNSLHRKVLI